MLTLCLLTPANTTYKKCSWSPVMHDPPTNPAWSHCTTLPPCAMPVLAIRYSTNSIWIQSYKCLQVLRANIYIANMHGSTVRLCNESRSWPEQTSLNVIYYIYKVYQSNDFLIRYIYYNPQLASSHANQSDCSIYQIKLPPPPRPLLLHSMHSS